MDLMMDRAKLPLRMSYRAVGSSTGQAEFKGGDNFAPNNDFGSGDIPISTEDYNALTAAGVEFVHLPIVLGAISLFHSVPNVSTVPGQGLNLTACVIARIFKREITTWDHEDVQAMNPNLNLPSENYPITVAHRVLGSSSTASVTEVRCFPTVCGGDHTMSLFCWFADTFFPPFHHYHSPVFASNVSSRMACRACGQYD